MTASPAPAVPAEILTMLRADAPGVVNAAAIAPAVSLPPGMAPVPAIAFEPAMAALIDPPQGIEASQPAPAAQAAPTPGPQAGAGVPAEPEIPAPAFIGSRVRSRTITLEWPMQYGGKAYTAVVVSRPSVGQVSAYFDRLLAATESAAALRFPVFYDVSGSPLPDVVMDAMDPDDADKVMEAVSDFLPARLRRLQAPQPEPSPQPAGDLTAQTS